MDWCRLKSWTMKCFFFFLWKGINALEFSYETIHHNFISWDLNAANSLLLFLFFIFCNLRLRDKVQPKTACIADCVTEYYRLNGCHCMSYQSVEFMIFICFKIKTVAGSQKKFAACTGKLSQNSIVFDLNYNRFRNNSNKEIIFVLFCKQKMIACVLSSRFYMIVIISVFTLSFNWLNVIHHSFIYGCIAEFTVLCTCCSLLF